MTRDKNHTFRAVTVKPCSDSCAAAQVNAGKRLLINEFEELVLKYCRKPLCKCDFQQHKDRRSGCDRRYSAQNCVHPISTSNRRLNYGRRVDDVHNRSRDATGEIDLSRAVMEFFAK